MFSELVTKYNDNHLMWHKVATLANSGYIYFHKTGLFHYTENNEYRARLFYIILYFTSHLYCVYYCTVVFLTVSILTLKSMNIFVNNLYNII